MSLLLGYIPMPAEDANALFQVISQRYLNGSIILTTNRGVASWGDIFDDTTIAAAMLDRLLHRSVVFNITGDSYRMRADQARARQLTQGVTLQSNPARVRSFDEQPWRTSAGGGTMGVRRINHSGGSGCR